LIGPVMLVESIKPKNTVIVKAIMVA
jgi:hypothetical protein